MLLGKKMAFLVQAIWGWVVGWKWGDRGGGGRVEVRANVGGWDCVGVRITGK